MAYITDGLLKRAARRTRTAIPADKGARPDGTISLDMVKMLNLHLPDDYGKIETVENLDPLTSLEMLNMSYNAIATISTRSFAPLRAPSGSSTSLKMH